MIIYFNQTQIQFELSKEYIIELKDSTRERVKVIGFYNPSSGKPSIQVINLSWGWIQFIPIENIKIMF